MQKKSNQKGFTIIEVLIVLAIAALILLVVFLAVPALQRNSRNTALKNDVSNVLGGVSEFSAANSGKLPQDVDDASGSGTVTYKLTTGGNTTTATIRGGTKVTTTTTVPGTPAAGEIQVVLGKKCDATTNLRAVSVYYLAEGAAVVCQDS